MGLITFKFLRESGRRRLSFIPNVCTLANAFFGFLAVVRALDGDYQGAAQCMVCAAVMDMLDGRIARFFGMTSSIGMELDSLCDAVSFCCVPALVMYSWALHAQGIVGLSVLALYLCCGLFRLARFNVATVADARYFIGLPTTAAALCVASLVGQMPLISAQDTYAAPQSWGILSIVGVLALLMISTVRFPSFKCMPRLRTLNILAAASVCGGVYVYTHAWPFTLVVPFSYVIVCVVFDVYRRMMCCFTGK